MKTRAAFVGLALAGGLGGGCNKASPSPPAPPPSVDRSSLSVSSAPPSVAAPDAGAVAYAPSPTIGEARRFALARLEEDPLLRAQGALLREHFAAAAGESARGPFAVQSVDLATGAKALLVARADETAPIVVAVDRDRLEWQKPRPVTGMVQPAGHVTLAPRPDGGAAIFVWVDKLQTVAARMWADDGNAFGDFEVFKPDRCDSMSVAYGPGLGWIVACASPSGVRAARLREDATLAGDPSGVALGSGHSTGPVAIAIDSPTSFVLVEPAAAVSADRLLAYRYDASLAPLWPNAVDLGVVGHTAARVEARAAGSGIVRVEFARSPNEPRNLPRNAPRAAVEVTSSGEVHKRPVEPPLERPTGAAP